MTLIRSMRRAVFLAEREAREACEGESGCHNSQQEGHFCCPQVGSWQLHRLSLCIVNGIVSACDIDVISISC